VAGIGNKDREWWRYIIEFDFVSLSETWVDEKGWKIWKDKMPSSHTWECVFAVKCKNKGRAKGGFIIGKKKEWRTDKCRLLARKGEGVIRSDLKIDREQVSIISVYGEQGGKNLIESLENITEAEGEENIIIGGDFNLRIGNLGNKEEGEKESYRHSKDSCLGNGGKRLVDWINEKGWEILNGCTEGDWEGEYTYVGARGCSVIDYVIVNELLGNRISSFRIGDRVDSDHMPMELTMELTMNTRRRKGQGKKILRQESKKRKVIEKYIWSQEAKEEYAKKTEELCSQEGTLNRELLTIEEKWTSLKRIILSSMIKKRIRIKKKELGDKDWWDRRCTKGKRAMRKMYWKWRKKKIGKNLYLEERKKFKSMLNEVQKEKRIKEEEELRNMKKESEVWKFINKKRGARKWTENNIGEKEWRKYFMDLLEGEELDTRKEESLEEIELEGHEDIGLEEVKKAIKKLKMKKAAGIDGIPMEAWKFARAGIVKELVDLIKLVFSHGILPRDWRRNIILPLYKRGEKEEVTNYRGISLLCSAYKVYAEILRSRMEEEVERKG